jgi:hypothetical protein
VLKIDGAVALSFAVVAAEQFGVPADIDLGFTDDRKLSQTGRRIGR